ncbi:hypothetical protein [Streptomyces sp. AK02-04a]|uniref:hypothetical protein n=1 Tax=Streptomyces sp. AK02-04a TaxID=3028649 RepID=UPI0029BDD141|nr:hypothetical protein [Streptomyces sp. AK02-04a]MDX3762592.1 hypothetical protein [Streptomyces sp. AK02-04a]
MGQALLLQLLLDLLDLPQRLLHALRNLLTRLLTGLLDRLLDHLRELLLRATSTQQGSRHKGICWLFRNDSDALKLW